MEQTKNKMTDLFNSFKGKLITILSACLAIAILAAIFIAAWKDTAYVEPLDTYFDVFLKGKSINFDELAPREYWKHLRAEQGVSMDEIEEEFKIMSDNSRRDMEISYGEFFSVDYEVLEVEDLSTNKLNKIRKALEDEYDIEEDQVKEGKKLEVMLTIEGSERTEMDEAKFTMIKIDDEWYMVDYHYADGEGSASFARILD